jgi:hypothetical protein
MKVHTYIIEVMWVMLAVLGIWIYATKLGVLFNTLIMQRNLQNKPPFTNQIRPPPLINWSCQKSLTIKQIYFTNQLAIRKCLWPSLLFNRSMLILLPDFYIRQFAK